MRTILWIVATLFFLCVSSAQAQSALELIHPNGGEIFLAGSEVTISWSGLGATDTVRLEYSMDNGASWVLIKDRITGNSFSWKTPQIQRRTCRIRVTRISTGADAGWAQSYPNVGYMVGNGTPIATDHLGNVIMAVAFGDSATVGSTTFYSTNNDECDLLLAKLHPSGAIDWVKHVTGTAEVYPHSVATDAIGQVYITGSFEGTANFDGQLLTSTAYKDVFVAKYSSEGNLLWVSTASGSEFSAGVSLVVDASENVYVVGYFTRDIQFEEIALDELGGCGDFFIAKYRSNGSIEWAKRGGGRSSDYAYSVALDSMGDVYFTGTSEGPGKFEGHDISDDGYNSAFLIKCHPDGTVAWVQHPQGKRAGVNEGVWIYSQEVTIDKGGNSYIVGFFGSALNASLSFGDTTELLSEGSFDLFLAKYAPTGELEWVQKIGSEWDDRGVSISIDPDGNIVATGYFRGQVHFGTIALTGVDSRPDIFVAKFLPNGTVSWARSTGGREKDQYSNVYDDRAGGIRADNFGNIYVTGFFTATSEFGAHTLKAQNRTDLFLWKIAPEAEFESDSSDAAFSILMPLLIGHDVDMGDVPVGEKKDSVITSFILNAGTYYSLLNTIAITKDTTSAFHLISDFRPVTLLENGALDVAFRFQPSSVGTKTAQIVIITDSDTLYQTITGNGNIPLSIQDHDKDASCAMHISPNPANESIEVEIQIPTSERLQLKLINVLGLTVATLYDGEIATGLHKLDFNTSSFTPGSYYLSLVTPTVKRFARVDVVR